LNASDERRATTDEAGAGDRPARELGPENVRALRIGNGANCSSVGSVIDTLFLASAVGGAIFAAVCAALRDEPVRVVGERPSDEDAAPDPPREEREESRS